MSYDRNYVIGLSDVYCLNVVNMGKVKIPNSEPQFIVAVIPAQNAGTNETT